MFALAGTGAVTTAVGITLVTPAAALPGRWLVWGPCLAVVTGLSACLRRVRDPDSGWWTVLPVAGLAVIVIAALAAPDPRLQPELFLLFLAVYGGRQLAGTVALGVIACCAVAAAVLYAVREPGHTALLSTLYLDAVLVVLAGRLTVSGGRLRQQLSRAENQAALDPLTGLSTRRAFDAAMQNALVAADDRSTVALVLVDLDHFKEINDTDGHPAGDAVLAQTAALLRHYCRPGDVVARLGGDELAVLLRDIPVAGVAERARAICVAVAGHRFPTSYPVTVSVGAAHCACVGPVVEGLYQRADQALYAAKRQGRNRAVVFRSPPRPVTADVPR